MKTRISRIHTDKSSPRKSGCFVSKVFVVSWCDQKETGLCDQKENSEAQVRYSADSVGGWHRTWDCLTEDSGSARTQPDRLKPGMLLPEPVQSDKSTFIHLCFSAFQSGGCKLSPFVRTQKSPFENYTTASSLEFDIAPGAGVLQGASELVFCGRGRNRIGVPVGVPARWNL